MDGMKHEKRVKPPTRNTLPYAVCIRMDEQTVRSLDLLAQQFTESRHGMARRLLISAIRFTNNNKSDFRTLESFLRKEA